MPKVSVIVPNYNHAPYLKQRIDSILNQSYQDFELILLDDCSTDNSRDILSLFKNHPKVTHLELNSENSGSTFNQWNKGVELAQGEYVWIAESDDWAELNFLEIMIYEFEQRPSVGLAYVSSKLIDSNNIITYLNEQDNNENTILYSPGQPLWSIFSALNTIWNASAMMFKRSLYPTPAQRKLYLNMRYCGDWFFYVLIVEKGVDILEIKQTLNNFRIHSNNVSNSALASGRTFLEGLDIYSYVKKYLSFSNKILTAKAWAKNYCRYKRRERYSKEINLEIVSKMKSYHLCVWLFYLAYEPLYSIKNN